MTINLKWSNSVSHMIRFLPWRPLFYSFFSICFETNLFVSVLSVVSIRIQKRTEKFVFWFRETNQIQPKQIEFRFVSVRTENLFCFFRGHPSFYVAFLFFRFVSKRIYLIRLFRNWLKIPKQTHKKFVGFAKQIKNQPKQIEFQFVSVRTENFLFLFRGTLVFMLLFFFFGLLWNGSIWFGCFEMG
jgi:hypothetical protein